MDWDTYLSLQDSTLPIRVFLIPPCECCVKSIKNSYCPRHQKSEFRAWRVEVSSGLRKHISAVLPLSTVGRRHSVGSVCKRSLSKSMGFLCCVETTLYCCAHHGFLRKTKGWIFFLHVIAVADGRETCRCKINLRRENEDPPTYTSPYFDFLMLAASQSSPSYKPCAVVAQQP